MTTPEDIARLRASAWFDAEWYLRRYPDVALLGLSAEEHFLRLGVHMGRQPGPMPGAADAPAAMRLDQVERLRPLPPALLDLPGAFPRRSDAACVLVVAHQCPTHLFGGERSFLDILEGLRAIGLDTLVTLPSRGNEQYLEAVRGLCSRVFVLPYQWWRGDRADDARTILQFATIIREQRVDALHVNTIMLREPLLAARQCGVPAIVHAREIITHDRDLCEAIGLPADSIVHSVLESADFIVANSRATAACFSRPGSSCIVPNTVASTWFDVPPRAAADAPVVAMISSNLPKKGITDFVQLARAIEPRVPAARFVLVGPRNEHTEALEADGVPPNLSIHGYAHDPGAVLAGVDIVLNLSHFQESFGRTVLEAMAAGRPVVAYDWGALQELVDDGVTGRLVPFRSADALADSVAALCEDAALRASMGQAGRQKALQRYSAKAYADAMALAYAAVLPGAFSDGNGAGTPVRVSAVIPNYNYARFLPQRIASILAQTVLPAEIIVLDDASSDDSMEVARAALQQCPIPWRIIGNERNQGTYRQWQRAAAEAVGEFVWIAEADDTADPRLLERLLSQRTARTVISYCQSRIIDEHGHVLREANTHHTDDLDRQRWNTPYTALGTREVVDYLAFRNTIPNVSACLLHRDALRECGEGLEAFRFCGDWVLYCRMLARGDIAYCAEPLNGFRRHGSSVTRSQQASTEYLDELVRVKDAIIRAFPIVDRQIGGLLRYLDRDFRIQGVRKNSETPAARVLEVSARELASGRRRLAFLTTNNGSYNGGSEMLWQESALRARELGHDVVVLIKRWDPEPPFLAACRRSGIDVWFKEDGFARLAEFDPDLLVVSTGDQDEGTEWFGPARRHGIPYVIVNQLTKEPAVWPIRKEKLEAVRAGYLHARRCYFTCRNNIAVMERRLDRRIPRTAIHFNPFHVPRNPDLPFPSTDGPLRLAMPARLLRIHKGQHLAIEVMARKQWRSRALELHLYGDGPDGPELRRMVADLGLDSVHFHLRTPDLLAIWRQNHGILMTSFMEGLPIVLVGAMLCGRVPILTDVGGHAEVVEDGASGFLAPAPTTDAIDAALERAWAARGQWEAIGRKARESILAVVPEDPVGHFTSDLLQLVGVRGIAQTAAEAV